MQNFKLTKKNNTLLILSTFCIGIFLTFFLNRPEKLLKLGDTALNQGNYYKSYNNYKQTTLLYPFLPGPHTDLAKLYTALNDWERARKEILIAQDLDKNNPILQEELSQINNKIQEPAKIQQELGRWKQITQDKPDYRDAWIQLSLLHYQLYQKGQAKEALEHAKKIDPNNETVTKLESLFSQ